MLCFSSREIDRHHHLAIPRWWDDISNNCEHFEALQCTGHGARNLILCGCPSDEEEEDRKISLHMYSVEAGLFAELWETVLVMIPPASSRRPRRFEEAGEGG